MNLTITFPEATDDWETPNLATLPGEVLQALGYTLGTINESAKADEELTWEIRMYKCDPRSTETASWYEAGLQSIANGQIGAHSLEGGPHHGARFHFGQDFWMIESVCLEDSSGPAITFRNYRGQFDLWI